MSSAVAARLPRKASPAKVAKNGQHNNDDDDDPEPGRHVILSLGACRFYARLEEAALTTARALQEISGHWDAVYEAMRREEVVDQEC